MDHGKINIVIDWTAIRDEINLQTVIKDHGGAIVNGKFLCPAHNDKNPSAALLPKKKKQRWVCYGCGEGGSCIDYVMHSMNLTRNEAALYLGKTYGVGLSEELRKEPGIASMLSKEILHALGLKNNPFFAVREHVQISPEKMGTEWEMSSVPGSGYEKDMGAMKLDDHEARELLSKKCIEYLSNHTKNTSERKTIEKLLMEITKNNKKNTKKQEKDNDDYELGA